MPALWATSDIQISIVNTTGVYRELFKAKTVTNPACMLPIYCYMYAYQTLINFVHP